MRLSLSREPIPSSRGGGLASPWLLAAAAADACRRQGWRRRRCFRWLARRRALGSQHQRAVWERSPRRDERDAPHDEEWCGHHRRRDIVGASAVAGLALAAWPQPASAGAFVDLMTSVFPVKEARRAFANYDRALRDSFSTFIDDNVQLPPQPIPVADAAGAEAAVFAAGGRAARRAGIDVDRVAAGEMALRDDEGRRFRQRVALGIEYFESEKLGRMMKHLSERTEGAEDYAFRAYCRWLAYNKELESLGDAATRVFKAEFGRSLLDSLSSVGALPKPMRIVADASGVAAFASSLKALLDLAVRAGLAARVAMEVDDVLVDEWLASGVGELPLPVFAEGDPLVDAQVVLAEEEKAKVSPDALAAVLDAWLGKVNALSKNAKPPVRVAFEQFFVNTRFQRKSELKSLTYIPLQRFFQVTLSAGAQDAAGE